MSDYDSDEAPEAVDFKTSKSRALTTAKAASEAVQKSKLKQSEARKKRQELFKQQKDDKAARLKELKATAPSDEILNQLPDVFERKTAPRSDKESTLTKFVHADEDDDAQKNHEAEVESEDFLSLDSSQSKKKRVKRVHLREETHGSTTFQIVSNRDQKSINHISESVLNFRKAKTFGHLSRVKRESADDRLRRLAKMAPVTKKKVRRK